MIVNRKSIYYLRLFSDLLMLNAAFFIAAIAAQSFDTLMERNHMFILEAVLNFAWYFLGNAISFYDDFARRIFVFQLIGITKNIFIQALISIIFIFILKEDLFTRNFILYYSLFLFVLVILRLILFRKILKKLRKKGINIRNLLIIGAGDVARKFRKLITENPDFGYKFTGFLSKDFVQSDTEVIGNYNQLEEVIFSRSIDEVVLALPQNDNALMDEMFRICNRNAVKTHIIPDYFRFVSQRFQVSMVGNFPIITSRNEPLEEIQWRIVKRIFDFIFSLLVVVLLLSILFPVISLITKLTSPGPIFYIQDRIGAKNKSFRCYKFRTLHINNTPDVSFEPVTENDPRITSFGKFLRSSNIDELPQFINVLKGEMSIVGPRPYPRPYDNRYGKIFEDIKLRHNVKPGITGWAQIHGLRGDVIDDDENKKLITKRIEYDLWYIENWSITLDFQIILITVWNLLWGKTGGL